MKTTIKNLKQFMMCILLVSFIGCSKSEDDSPNPTGIVEQNGISADELESYEGDIGLRINTRAIAKKGYKPTKVMLDMETTQGDYDQELTIDPFTNIAQLLISVEDLTPEAKDELIEGVPIVVTVFDVNDTEIISNSITIVSLEEGGTDLDVEDETLDYNSSSLSFKSEMPYFLQPVSANGSYGSGVLEIPLSAGTESVSLREVSSNFSADKVEQQYYFQKLNEDNNVFAILSKNTDRYLFCNESTGYLRQSHLIDYDPNNTESSLAGKYKFIISREQNGLFTITNVSSGNTLKRVPNGSNTFFVANPTGEIQYFRFVGLNLTWDVQQIQGTEYLSPILPSVDTSFGFNSTLVNCGSGGLEQEVGIERDVTTSTTVGWEESLSISTREEFSASVTVGVEVEADYFAGSATASAEATASYTYSQEVNASQSQYSDQTTGDSQTYFATRIVTVPAGSASLVYDAYQTYSNVKIPFVKRFRIFSTEINPNTNTTLGSLSGQDIATQLLMTDFKGLITTISSDFIEVTLRGTTVLDNLIEIQSEVQDVAANCN